MKAWIKGTIKTGVIAFILSIVWCIFGFFQSLKYAILPASKMNVVDKIITLPILIYIRISKISINLFGKDTHIISKNVSDQATVLILVTIFIAAILILLFYKVFRLLKERLSKKLEEANISEDEKA